VLPRGAAPRLGFLTPMEREEAAATGLALLTPADLDVSRWSSELARSGRTFLSQGGGGRAPGALRASLPAASRSAGHGPGGKPSRRALRGPEPCRVGVGAGQTRLMSRGAPAQKRPAELAGPAGSLGGPPATPSPRRGEAAGRQPTISGDGGPVAGRRAPARWPRLAAEIARVLSARGTATSKPRGKHHSLPAEEGAISPLPARARRIVCCRAGESLVVDILSRKGRLFSDCTPDVLCVGEPLRTSAPRACRGARGAGRGEPEIPSGKCAGWEVQEAVCARLRGPPAYPDGPSPIPAPHAGLRSHNLGHGVGLRDPTSSPHLQEIFLALRESCGKGDVFTLEPGLYDPEERWAVRLEDLHHLTEGRPRGSHPAAV